MRERRVLIGTLLIAAASLLTACGSSNDTGNEQSRSGSTVKAASAVPTPASLSSRGSLRVCTDPGYGPPMSYLDAGGRYQGVDPDIARAVAQAMGVEAEFATVGFDAFIPSVQQDRCDIYMAGVTVTRERATQVHFTEYLDVGTQLLVPWGNPKGITTLDGASGKSMGVVVGSVGKQIFDRLNKELAAAGKPEVTIRVFNNGTAAAQALLAGQIDGFAQDSVGMVALLKQYPQRVELGLPAPVNKLPLGIVSNRNRADLNSALAAAVCRLYTDKTIPRTLTRAGLANAAYSGACR